MNSKIILVKNINIDRQYTNVLSYTEAQMLELCVSQGHLVAQAENYSFLRNTGTIMAGFTYAQCLQANYIAFQNPDYSNKWFFAWIDEVIYKGDKNTEITFTIDAWSTWFDKWNKKVCFINRQHVNDDTIGLHTLPENLDVGEVIEEQETEDESYGNLFGYYVGVLSNWRIKDGSTGEELLPINKGSQNAGISVYDNTVFGEELFLFNITSLESFRNLALFLIRTNYDGHIEDVKNIFIIPNMAISNADLIQHNAVVGEVSFNWYTINYNTTPTKFNTTINKRTSFSNFSPKNNKCFVYPYNYLFVSNNNGSNNIYKYEDFTTENCVFENQFSISIGGSGRIVPKNYKNMSTNDDEALPAGKYPTCAWSSDAFTNWLTQNGINLVASIALTAGGVATAIATGGATMPIVAGAISSVAGTIAGTIGQFNQASLMPNIAGGQATGDVIWACNRNKFTFREMRAKTEYLKIIDDYFTRFRLCNKKFRITEYYWA